MGRAVMQAGLVLTNTGLSRGRGERFNAPGEA